METWTNQFFSDSAQKTNPPEFLVLCPLFDEIVEIQIENIWNK